MKKRSVMNDGAFFLYNSFLPQVGIIKWGEGTRYLFLFSEYGSFFQYDPMNSKGVYRYIDLECQGCFHNKTPISR